MKESKKKLDDSLKQNSADKPLTDEELTSVTGGLLGVYADTTIDYANDCKVVLVEGEKPENAK